MAKQKVFNDPIYGLISFPFELIYTLIDDPFFQRLRRIQQTGLSSLVYPGAVHSRFHHALGVAHLCSELIILLRIKGVDIDDEEFEACIIAALLHDLGHGPFSHALEGRLINCHHEVLTLAMMEVLNERYDGRLEKAIQIFKNEYHKQFLHQILSGQIDVDRMDYLNRDSYYTGVAEGIIGYDRIIRMMDVMDGRLVIEEKGIYSVEKFLMSRYMMYRQVYLHKTAMSAERMLMLFIDRLLELIENEHYTHRVHQFSEALRDLLYDTDRHLRGGVQLQRFVDIDDYDVIQLLKTQQDSRDTILSILAKGLLKRNLFRTIVKKAPFSRDFVINIRHNIERQLHLKREEAQKMIIESTEKTAIYNAHEEILIKRKSHIDPVPFSEITNFDFYSSLQIVNTVTFPKEIDV